MRRCGRWLRGLISASQGRSSARVACPRVLLLAPPRSYRTAAYIAAAGRLGIDIIVASEGIQPLTPEVVRGLRVDLSSPQASVDAALEEAQRHPIAGVIATDDNAGELASRVAAALGVCHNPVASAHIARRKDLARAALAKAGLPVPWFRRLDLHRDLEQQASELRYPCVLKPLALSGSRGVIRADDAPSLVAAGRRVAAILSDLDSDEERRFALVEEFLPGTEVALEGMLSSGRLEVLAIFDKPDPLNGPFFEETYYITPSRLAPETQALIRRRVGQACAAYGLAEGPVHAELRIGGGEAWVLEVAARTIGGDCARLLEFGTGRSLEEMVLRHALGQPLELSEVEGAAGVLMIPTAAAGTLRRVEGVLAAERVPYVEDVVIAIREGYELVPLPEGSSYLGFIFAHGPTPELVEAALREAHACLKVVVAPAWRLEPA